jgi:integrase
MGTAAGRIQPGADRNRLMLALAYDSRLRREELCSLRTDDFDALDSTSVFEPEGLDTSIHLPRGEITELADFLQDLGWRAAEGGSSDG